MNFPLLTQSPTTTLQENAQNGKTLQLADKVNLTVLPDKFITGRTHTLQSGVSRRFATVHDNNTLLSIVIIKGKSATDWVPWVAFGGGVPKEVLLRWTVL